jgi:hypothetical protein
MFLPSSHSKWALFPVLLCVLALSSCGGADNSSPVGSSSIAPSASVPITSTSITPSETPSSMASASATPLETPTSMASSTASPTGAMTVGTKPQQGECPKDEPIKGNIGKHGKIYHVPDSKGYAEVKPEACFATNVDAEKAGFHAPKAIAEHSTKSP